MAISDVITSMNQHTKAAYDALEAKGAELPQDKNLENLAGIIENLPAGGNYGTVTIENPDGTTATLALDLGGFLGMSGATSETPYFIVDGQQYSKNTIVAYDTGDSLTTLLPRMFTGSYWDDETGQSVEFFTNLKSIRLGASVKVVADQFLEGSAAEPESLELVAVEEIGHYFGRSSKLNVPLTLPNTLTKIGNGFLSSANSFNSELTLPDSLQEIGREFLAYSRAYTQTLTLPASITSIGNTFMFNTDFVTSLITETTTVPEPDTGTANRLTLATNSNGEPIFTTGVSISGAGADAWRAALPNEVDGPYRKIIGNPMPQPYMRWWTTDNETTPVEIYNDYQAMQYLTNPYTYYSFPTNMTKLELTSRLPELGVFGLRAAWPRVSGTNEHFTSLSVIEGLEYLPVTDSDAQAPASFMSDLWGLPETFTVPTVYKSIGDNAYSGLIGVSKIIIPSEITYIGNGAFGNPQNLTQLEVQAADVLVSDSTGVNSLLPFSTNYTTVPCYETGITVSGVGAQNVVNALENRDTSPPYRKIILATEAS